MERLTCMRVNGMYKLTDVGKRRCEKFIEDCNSKREIILDAGYDTAEETSIPSVEGIESDINVFGADEDGEYYNGWGVTDHYDYLLCLKLGIDFLEVQDEKKQME